MTEWSEKRELILWTVNTHPYIFGHWRCRLWFRSLCVSLHSRSGWDGESVIRICLFGFISYADVTPIVCLLCKAVTNHTQTRARESEKEAEREEKKHRAHRIVRPRICIWMWMDGCTEWTGEEQRGKGTISKASGTISTETRLYNGIQRKYVCSLRMHWMSFYSMWTIFSVFPLVSSSSSFISSCFGSHFVVPFIFIRSTFNAAWWMTNPWYYL